MRWEFPDIHLNLKKIKHYEGMKIKDYLKQKSSDIIMVIWFDSLDC